jgi:hypothetical protein
MKMMMKKFKIDHQDDEENEEEFSFSEDLFIVLISCLIFERNNYFTTMGLSNLIHFKTFYFACDD